MIPIMGQIPIISQICKIKYFTDVYILIKLPKNLLRSLIFFIIIVI